MCETGGVEEGGRDPYLARRSGSFIRLTPGANAQHFAQRPCQRVPVAVVDEGGFAAYAEAPRMNRARSRRSMSNGVRHLTPRPMKTLGILILFFDGDGISWVTTA